MLDLKRPSYQTIFKHGPWAFYQSQQLAGAIFMGLFSYASQKMLAQMSKIEKKKASELIVLCS